MSGRLPKDKYVIKLEISMEKLTGLPSNSGPANICYGMFVQMMVNRGKQNGGYDFAQQRMLYRVRTAIEAVVKTQETEVILDREEFEFLDFARREAKMEPESNEAVIRIGTILDDAIAEHKARDG